MEEDVKYLRGRKPFFLQCFCGVLPHRNLILAGHIGQIGGKLLASFGKAGKFGRKVWELAHNI